MTYRAEVSTAEQAAEALSVSEFEYVYVPMEYINTDTPDKNRIIAVPPVFLGGREREISEQLRSCGVNRVSAHTLGHIGLIGNAGLIPHGGFRLNVTNSSALRKYAELGLADCICSLEMPAKDIGTGDSPIPRGFMAYGYMPFMLMRYDPGEDLTDRLGNSLQVIKRYDETEVLNPVALVTEGVQADFAVLRFSPDERVHITPEYEKHTRGLYGKSKKT